jgi:hypothetical protein
MKLTIQIKAGIIIGLAAIAWLGSSSIQTKTVDMRNPLSETGPIKPAHAKKL